MGSYSYLNITVPEVHEKDVLALLKAGWYDSLKPVVGAIPGTVTFEGEAKSGDYYLVEEEHDIVDGKWVTTGPAPMMEWVEMGIPFDIYDGGDGAEIESRITFWRPGMDRPETRPTDNEGWVVITLAQLEKLGSFEAAKEYLSDLPPIL